MCGKLLLTIFMISFLILCGITIQLENKLVKIPSNEDPVFIHGEGLASGSAGVIFEPANHFILAEPFSNDPVVTINYDGSVICHKYSIDESASITAGIFWKQFQYHYKKLLNAEQRNGD
jgi:hypothetical protein